MRVENCPMDHRLIFSQVNDDDDHTSHNCNNCHQPIAAPNQLFIYCCREADCLFFLHKSCAELRKEIKFKFRDHNLYLNSSSSPEHYCDICETHLNGYYYSCRECEFSLHPNCSTKASGVVRNACHPHNLYLLITDNAVRRSWVKFQCRACDHHSSSCGYAYCRECEALFDTNCALLPSIVVRICHEHPLLLTDPRHDRVDSVATSGVCIACNVCRQERNSNHWFYVCQQCNFVAHTVCVTPKFVDHTILDRGMPRAAKVAEGEADRLVGLKHSGHDHILAFSGSDPEEEHICNGCLELISGSSYTCADCRFFLHESCANLPTQIKTKFHTGHSLYLQPFSPTLPRICDVCGCNVQGFYYHCETRDFDTHPKCSNSKNFPYGVRHPSHKHILYFYAREESPIAIHCSGCGHDSESIVFYICWNCKLYYHVRYTLLPLTISGKCYNGHPLKVTCVPHNAMEQYFCDVCEMNRHPDEWVYYCGNCNYIVHLNCVT